LEKSDTYKKLHSCREVNEQHFTNVISIRRKEKKKHRKKQKITQTKAKRHTLEEATSRGTTEPPI